MWVTMVGSTRGTALVLADNSTSYHSEDAHKSHSADEAFWDVIKLFVFLLARTRQRSVPRKSSRVAYR